MSRIDPTFGDLAELRTKMLQWARKLTRGGHQAEDLVQDTLLRMFANKHRFLAGSSVEAWAFTIMRNRNRDEVQREGRAQFLPLTDIHVAPDDPFTALYCRQVCDFLGFDATMLLAQPSTEAPLTNQQKCKRHRLRRSLAELAA